MGDNKNFLLAIVLSMVVLLGWQYFVGIPNVKQREQRQQKIAQMKKEKAIPAPSTAPAGKVNIPTPDTGAGSSGQPAPKTGFSAVTDRATALKASRRIAISTPRLKGSLSLTGGRLDDLELTEYHVTVDKSSPAIVLLSPSGSTNAYYIQHGWTAKTGAAIKLPGDTTVWTAGTKGPLTPSNPVTLSWDNGEGLVFKRTFTIDDHYMFAVRQEVVNSSGKAVSLFPYALVSRHGLPKSKAFYILHEGLIGIMGEGGLEEETYKDIKKDIKKTFKATGGWMGMTDKYWAAIIIPDQKAPFTARFSEDASTPEDVFQVDYLREEVVIPAGGSAGVDSHVFAGAKKVSLIDDYQDQLKIEKFELLIDWGWLHFITKPMFTLLNWFYSLVGNFGIAILLVTVVVKLLFFPLANKSYTSMAKMKKLQPEIARLKDLYKDDRVKQQQAQMELFKKEKVNPMSGCLPMIIQIPVFFSLYKVLFVTLEMRHAPFFGWVRDLAAPDPTNIFTLFGMIPWDPPQFLTLGIWPLVMGITMFVQMKLNPAPADPIQEKLFTWMPVIFTFMLASFPVGLVIYWSWNNVLSTAQQAVIMKRNGVDIPLLENLLKTFGGKKKKTGAAPNVTPGGKGNKTGKGKGGKGGKGD